MRLLNQKTQTFKQSSYNRYETLLQTFLCPDCDLQLEIENATAWFNIYENVASKSLCKVKDSAKMVVVYSDMISYDISTAHVLIENLQTVTTLINTTREI